MSETTSLSPQSVDPSEPTFWTQPISERAAAFDLLRQQPGLPFFSEPEAGELPVGPGFYAVTRFRDIVEASKRPALFCSGRGATSIIDVPAEFREFYGSMIELDDPRHARMRRIVSRAFTPAVTKRLEQHVEEVAADIVSAVIDRGECDFVTEVAAQLPLRVICEMMGVPQTAWPFVLDRTNIILGAGDPEYIPSEDMIFGELIRAGQELADLVAELGTDRAAKERHDVVSDLVNAEIDGERLTPEELASFFILLVTAGSETTRNAIAWGLHWLTEHPDQRAIWEADFEAVAPTAVDEIVRLASPVIQMRRTATCDVVLGGQQLHDGDKVVLYYWAANRDGVVFTDPHRFDVRRADNRHLGFGAPGPHFCLGAHLARREITVMFRELFQRVPDIEASSQPVRLRSDFINGVKHLDCRFTPGGNARD
ncbi:MAG: cytochrome P450 [Acidimicrobiales bacterium]|jgi:methyl-branched lipid omega-hydroxylase